MGPLHTLRVVELGAIGPVPMAATLLADLGAQVLRIDRLQASGLGLPVDPRHEVHGRSRRSAAFDLKRPEAVQAVLRIVQGADVLLEGFRPGVAERLGLGPQACLARNPALVYGRMTGFGQEGPLAQAAGHDLNYIALSGALAAIGTAQDPPVPPLNLVGDYGGGALYLVFGVMAALFERSRSGQGQVVDAAMVDGAASLMGLFHGLHAAGQWSAQRGHNLLDGGAPFYAAYRTRDGQSVAVGALEPKFFAELARLIGLDPSFVEQQYERACWPAMRSALSEIFGRRTRDEWSALLEGTDACVTPVLSLAEAHEHPHALARSAYVRVGEVVQPAPAPRFGRSVPAAPQPSPQPGAHTLQVLAELGMRAEEIEALRVAGAIA